MSLNEETELMHYGVKRRSGRYPWGSGDSPYQHSGDFLSRISELKQKGLSETDIAKELGMSTTELRVAKQAANHERRELLRDRNKSLIEDGLSRAERARILGLNESSLRSLENEETASNKNKARTTADVLKRQLETKGMIDVGAGAERELGISKQQLSEALLMLEMEGYNVYGVGIPQVTNPRQQTITKVLTNPDIGYGDTFRNMGNIQSVTDYHSTDGGLTFDKVEYPASIDSNRVAIRYGDQGGLAKDGVIEIRRGVDDLSLGNSHYAQVRILVDGTHYLKGMAIYSDDLPAGTDIVFNTNKKSDVGKMDVLKKIKDDPDNPFGALVMAKGQYHYVDADGNTKLGAINKLKEEGDWEGQAKTLSQQFLSKQPMSLMKKQLNLTYADYQTQYDEIMSITNPTLKKKMLLDFADECDSAAVYMKAAALPRQKTQVILPIDNLKDNEIYAPNYKNGEKVALIRYPHGGIFEIPILTVNNKNEAARKILGTDISDAVGINSKVAEKLSGADFDGDTVTVIPTHNASGIKIASAPKLKDLDGFEPKIEYAERQGMKYMQKKDVQKQMGMISNLITDMTLHGATDSELARAVKHSMVVIDAEKHKLDYTRSEKENGIQELKEKYQRRIDPDTGELHIGGASTLLSRRKQEVEVPERKGSMMINDDGTVSYKESGRTYVDPKTGKVKAATTKVSLMSTKADAHELSSGTLQEDVYADYANKMKALANESRKAYKSTPNLEYSPSAKKTYAEEVKSLENSLAIAEQNAPRERRAQAIANSVVKAKVQENPSLKDDKKSLNKVRQVEINKAREQVGATGKGTRINISDKEWEAIQAGAISDSKLNSILRYTDQDALKQRALPKTTGELSLAKQNKIASMRASGYTNAEIAEEMGISTTTVIKYA